MEFLKEIFGDGSLTYDELAAKLKDNKDIKLANLAGGMYVDKRKLTDKENELAAANQKISGLEKAVKEFDGVDVKALNAQIKTLQDKYDTDVAGLKLNSALDMALVNAKAHHMGAAAVSHDLRHVGEIDVHQVALHRDDLGDALGRRTQNVVGLAERLLERQAPVYFEDILVVDNQQRIDILAQFLDPAESLFVADFTLDGQR